MSNTTDIELGSIDSDKVVAVEIKHDDKLKEEDIAFFQVCVGCGLARDHVLSEGTFHHL